jgi:hypothetical protein
VRAWRTNPSTPLAHLTSAFLFVSRSAEHVAAAVAATDAAADDDNHELSAAAVAATAVGIETAFADDASASSASDDSEDAHSAAAEDDFSDAASEATFEVTEF